MHGVIARRPVVGGGGECTLEYVTRELIAVDLPAMSLTLTRTGTHYAHTNNSHTHN